MAIHGERAPRRSGRTYQGTGAPLWPAPRHLRELQLVHLCATPGSECGRRRCPSVASARGLTADAAAAHERQLRVSAAAGRRNGLASGVKEEHGALLGLRRLPADASTSTRLPHDDEPWSGHGEVGRDHRVGRPGAGDRIVRRHPEARVVERRSKAPGTYCGRIIGRQVVVVADREGAALARGCHRHATATAASHGDQHQPHRYVAHSTLWPAPAWRCTAAATGVGDAAPEAMWQARRERPEHPNLTPWT